MAPRGIFISLEGPDGAGKSTQRRLLGAALRKAGHKVLETREPGGSPQSAKIRGLLLNGKGRLAERSELFLFLADRAQHVQDTILPALRQGKVVLCDRYSDSTLAYQGGGRGLDLGMLRALDRAASGGLAPRLTLLFDLEAPGGLRRAAGRKGGADRMERAGAAFHRRVRAAFLAIARREPGRVKLIRVAGKSPLEVRDEAWLHLMKALP